MKKPAAEKKPKALKANIHPQRKLNCNTDEFDDEQPQQMDLNKIEKTLRPEKINLYELSDDQKNLRQKAFKMMKKKAINKEELTKLSKMNFDNEPLNKKIQQTIFIPEKSNSGEINNNKFNEDHKSNASSNLMRIFSFFIH